MSQVAIAGHHGNASTAVPAGQYLTFVLGGETYSIGTLAIMFII